MTPSQPHISLLQVGMPVERPGIFGAPVFLTGFVKQPTEQAVWLKKDGLDGDGQGDEVHHGGPDKAVCVYSQQHYPAWSKKLGKDLGPGAFGENVTVVGWCEDSVCLGDQFRIGDEVVVEVSQPRGPCWKLAQVHQVKDLAYQLQTTGLTGWYFRVVKEGAVQVGDPVLRTAHPNPNWTIKQVNQVVYDRRATVDQLTALADCLALSAGWREKLRKRAQSGLLPDDRPRLHGPTTSC